MTHPRGVWIWQLADIDPNYLARLQEIGAKRIYLKVMDGRSRPAFWRRQCTPDIVGRFQGAGIEVYGWGYHYAVEDPTEEIAAVAQAMSCGLDGYIVDIEKEAEVPGADRRVTALLTGIRPHVKMGTLGYTSFGAPQYHSKIPWAALNQHTDFAMPQIYFEAFDFGRSNEDEVAQCLAKNKALPDIKEVIPIWSSEAGVKRPAPAHELQSYLSRFPGSSIWRVPKVGEAGEAWNLRYDERAAPAAPVDQPARLETITYVLRPGASGPEVVALRRLLTSLGYDSSGPEDVFDSSLEQAVRRFQTIANIGVDGKVGPETIAALTGRLPTSVPELGLREQLALVAQREGDLHLRWENARSEAEKYLEPLREEMYRRRHIGREPVFYNWCGAFVLWCCRQAGYNLPDAPAPTGPTFALVQSWADWAKRLGLWIPVGGVANRGDVVIYNWPDVRGIFDHIGIVSSFTPGSSSFRSSEGNTSNSTANQTRYVGSVVGYIRLPTDGVF